MPLKTKIDVRTETRKKLRTTKLRNNCINDKVARILAHPDLGSDMAGEGTEPTRRGSRGAGKLRGTRHYSKERARTVQESVVSTVQWKQAAKIPTHN